jgi:hypothetical protein
MKDVSVKIEGLEIVTDKKILSAMGRAAKKAGATAVRDMRAEATKRIRSRKRLKMGIIRNAIALIKPRGAHSILDMGWGLNVRGTVVPLIAYPHRQTRKGVSVAVNVGKRTLVQGAFIATMPKSGHKGIWRRAGKSRLPIVELYGSRPVDALLHQGESEGVLERGKRTFDAAFKRLLPIELAKGESK